MLDVLYDTRPGDDGLTIQIDKKSNTLTMKNSQYYYLVMLVPCIVDDFVHTLQLSVKISRQIWFRPDMA